MGLLGNAACPRCGAKPQSVAARFCPRCGMELPRMQQNPSVPNTPSWRGQPPAMPSYPPIQTPPLQYGQPPMQAGGYMPVAPQPRIVPPPKKKSGCGCLLALLLLVIVLAAIGTCSQRSSRKYNTATPTPILRAEVAPAQSLPPRSSQAYMPPPAPLGMTKSPVLQNATIRRVKSSNGDDIYRLTAQVTPGSLGRVLLVAYFLDGRGNPVKGMTFSHTNSQGTLSAGAWVSDGDNDDHEHDDHGSSAAYRSIPGIVMLDIPTQSAQQQPAYVQFSLFDDDQAEYARLQVSIPQRY